MAMPVNKDWSGQEATKAFTATGADGTGGTGDSFQGSADGEVLAAHAGHWGGIHVPDAKVEPGCERW